MASAPPPAEATPTKESQPFEEGVLAIPQMPSLPQPKDASPAKQGEPDLSEPSSELNHDLAAPPAQTEGQEVGDGNGDGELTMADLRAAVDDIDENLDDAFGQAADTFWNFATSVTGKVSSVVKEQPGLENLRKNVTSSLAPLDHIGRDIQSQIGALAPSENTIANLAGSVKGVAATVQRNAEAMEKAILAKANDVGPQKEDSDPPNADTSAELTMGDPGVGVLPVMRGSEGLDEIAKVGESVTHALGETVGDLWSGLWGGEDEEDEIARRAAAKVPKTRFEKRVFELQANPDTYCEPAKDLDAFEEWGKDFNLDDYADACIELLYSHDSIAELYERVVPRIVEEDTFWMRYFFAKHVLEKEEERRIKLLERAENAVVEGEDDEDGWGDDDWGDDTPRKKEDGGQPSSEPKAGPEDEPHATARHATTDGETQAKTGTESGGKASSEVEKGKTGVPVGKKEDKMKAATPAAQVEVQQGGDDDWGDDDWE